MALPSQPKTFALENCRDYLRKLEWEIEGLRSAPPSDHDGMAFRAFNGFVTAWHLADWVWRNMTEDQRVVLRTDWELPGMNDIGNFLGAVREKNRDLALCREIATASKHFEVTRTPDDTIETVASAATDKITTEKGEIIITEQGEEITTEFRWTLKVLDRDQKRPVIDVLERARDFWTTFIYERGIAQ